MAQTLINIRIDEELKRSIEVVCQELGKNMTTAFTMFAKKMSGEKKYLLRFQYILSFQTAISETLKLLVMILKEKKQS